MSDTMLPAERTAQPLPEFWPTMPAEKPARAIWLPWPMVVALAPLFWLMPKRLGPHFAAAGWRAALAAQLLWAVYGIGCIVVALHAPKYGWVAYVAGQSPGQQQPSVWDAPTFSEIVRTPLAALAIRAGYHIERGETFLLGLAKIVGIELALIAAGWLLVPFALSGQSVWRTFGRCARLTLWCSTSVIVPGLVLQGIVVFAGEGEADYAGNEYGILLCAYVAWFLWLWIRSGQRYAGPADSVVRQPRRPLCESCGYILTGLTEHDRCPECGTSIESSLPSRRKPPAYAEARSGLARVSACLFTAYRVIRDSTFFETMAIHGEHGTARRFAIRMCVLTSIAIGVLYVALFGWPWRLVYWTDVIMVVATVLVAPFVVVSAAVLSLRLGCRAAKCQATAAFYWSAWLPVLGVAAILQLAAGYHTERWWPGPGDAGRFLEYPALVLATIMTTVGLLIAVGIAGLRLRRISRQIRFANR